MTTPARSTQQLFGCLKKLCPHKHVLRTRTLALSFVWTFAPLLALLALAGMAAR